MDFKTVKERITRLDTACICDADKKLRVMDPAIRPLKEGLRMVGRARTVSCRGDFLGVIKALEEAREDEVLVVEGGGLKTAVAGELFTSEAKRKNLAGIVIDGACRDTRHIRRLDFPVYARHITPMGGTAVEVTETQITVECGGIAVSPNDILVGDDDGIVVIGEKEVEDVLASAESIQSSEERVLAHIQSGQSLLDMLNFTEHYEARKAGEDSRLFFKV